MLIENLDHLDTLDETVTIKGGEVETGEGELPPEIKAAIIAKKSALRQKSLSAVGNLSGFSDRFDGLGVRNRSSGGSSSRERILNPTEPDITSVGVIAENPGSP
ncbi:MAG: hypothetical protein AAF921_10130 [Cyanobacteria bacterium P01_D01_bin.44]